MHGLGKAEANEHPGVIGHKSCARVDLIASADL